MLRREHFPGRLPILVTGASGFIGGRVVRRLVAIHSNVSCLVRASSRIDALKGLEVQLIAGDVTDQAHVEAALDQSQAAIVLHLAGLVRARSQREFMRVNAGGVETIAAACADRADASVLVVVSSLAAAGPCPAKHSRTESDLPAPVSNYGRSKLAGERAAMRHAHRVPITIVRPPIVFGPGDRGLLQMFRPIARRGIHLAPGGKRSAEHRYSLVYVDDLANGVLLAAEKGERLCQNDESGQGIYYCAGSDQPTYAELGESMAAAMGRSAPVVIPVPGPLTRLAGVVTDVAGSLRGSGSRPGWISRDKTTEALAGSWTCSALKARAHLGWSPAGTLAERMSETAKWYRDAGWL